MCGFVEAESHARETLTGSALVVSVTENPSIDTKPATNRNQAKYRNRTNFRILGKFQRFTEFTAS